MTTDGEKRVVYLNDRTQSTAFIPDGFVVVYKDDDDSSDAVKDHDATPSSVPFTATATEIIEEIPVPPQPEYIEPISAKISPPKIDTTSFSTTHYLLKDGTVTCDVEFDVEEVDGAVTYEVRYL